MMVSKVSNLETRPGNDGPSHVRVQKSNAGPGDRVQFS